MNLLPNIAGHTVANWTFQDTLADISGNGLNGTAVDVTTGLPAIATYATIAPGLRAFNGDVGGAKVIVPLSPLLQFAGNAPMTFEWIMLQPQTYTFAYFTCADPALARGATPEALGSVYTVWSTRGLPHIADKFLYNDGHSGGPATELLPDTPNGSYTVVDWAGGSGAAAQVATYAITRDTSGIWHAYVNGAARGVPVPSLGVNTVTGVERFWIAGTENAVGSGAYYAGLRVLDLARTPAQIYDDAAYAWAGVGSDLSGVVYDAVAASQFSLALLQQPRK